MSRDLLEKLLAQGSLAPEDLDALFSAMLEARLPEPQAAAFLTAWRLYGESATELVAGAKALLRYAATPAISSATRPLIDNCGTGGDGAGSFNISTAAAIVAAASGVRMAKHGNRSVSSLCGSADLLFAAGFPENLDHEAATSLLHTTGFSFFFAPSFHPALKNLSSLRRALGIRTILNLLGPLANPVRPERQLVGVGARRFLEPMAKALQALGIERALVVHSRDGLDEISPAAPTDALLVEGAESRSLIIEPEALGYSAKREDLAGGDATVNLGILRALLMGEPLGVRSAVVLNAGAVIWLANQAPSLSEGVAIADRTLASGTAKKHFDSWVQSARNLAHQA